MLVSSDRLADPEGSLLRIDDDRCGAVAVAIVDGQPYAFQDTCTHQQCSPTSRVSVYVAGSEGPPGPVGSVLGGAQRHCVSGSPSTRCRSQRRQRGVRKSSGPRPVARFAIVDQVLPF